MATDRALEVLVGRGGLPVRDAGRILGISFQRTAQLSPTRSAGEASLGALPAATRG